MRLAIGIDGGGTKTEAIALRSDALMPEAAISGLLGPASGTPSSAIVARTAGLSTNPHAVTFDGAMANLAALLDALRAEPAAAGAEWDSVVLGLSGVSTDDEQAAVYRYLEQYKAERGMRFDCAIRNDAQIALMATLGREEGIIAISGTGSIISGLTPSGAAYRTGGWGHLLGDEGSGYDIGLRMLKTVMRSYDGILPPTSMTAALLERLGFASLLELKAYVYQPSVKKSDIAGFAEIAIRACEAGDPGATAVVEACAGELAAAAVALIRKDGWFTGCDLVMTGSVFKHSPTFAHVFRTHVAHAYPEIKFHTAEQPPAYGAALLALKTKRS
ncbi:BadF/BadG/BcrA/BcrD ATPase family protein [Paenibacillus koleovorans]|uniref:BadF/BadG/BcrA/BcrD ATPase family protein n=1 Tax=Paenibacillus koleovorans TaxID=121608 RepID=UPI000FDB68A7|nr:BadF/BadG/BcrA/BcrD ATPase family protein [Paenibacillus koleovorans]